MGKIFKISGNFERKGKWAEPNPYFTGEIEVENNGVFRGYSKESNGTKYLVGVITESKEGVEGIQFYVMSNDSSELPIFYDTHKHELGDSLNGRWHAMRYQLNSSQMCMFIPKGDAWVMLKKQPFSSRSSLRIDTTFKQLKSGAVINRKIIKSLLEFS